MFHLFKTTLVSSDIHLNTARRGLNIANTVNTGYLNEIIPIRNTYNQIMSLMKVLDQRITALETRADTTENLLSEVSQAVDVQEDEFGVQVAELVTDDIDVDHI